MRNRQPEVHNAHVSVVCCFSAVPCCKVFSRNNVTYDVIGPAVALKAVPPQFVVRAAAIASFSTVNETLAVYTVDQYGHALWQYDREVHTMTASMRLSRSSLLQVVPACSRRDSLRGCGLFVVFLIEVISERNFFGGAGEGEGRCSCVREEWGECRGCGMPEPCVTRRKPKDWNSTWHWTHHRAPEKAGGMSPYCPPPPPPLTEPKHVRAHRGSE